MNERKLAHIERIVSKRDIPGADKIEVVGVLGWECVAKKNEFNIGDLICYIEVDSKVPAISYFEFMKDRDYKVKTIKLRKQVSQGLVVPLSVLPKGKYKEGQDVTNVLGVTKILSKTEQADVDYKKHGKLYKFMMRYNWFRKLFGKPTRAGSTFPSFIVKTDEERIQNIPYILEKYADKEFFTTEKIDGQSGTYYKKGKTYGICSRNRKLKDKEGTWGAIGEQIEYKSVLDKIQKYYDADLVVFQGEVYGNGIQGNKYKVDGYDFRVFNLIIDGVKKDYNEMQQLMLHIGLQVVPLLSFGKLPTTVNEIVEMSKGKSLLNKNINREGIVCRCDNISFKVINPDFLLSEAKEDI